MRRTLTAFLVPLLLTSASTVRADPDPSAPSQTTDPSPPPELPPPPPPPPPGPPPPPPPVSPDVTIVRAPPISEPARQGSANGEPARQGSPNGEPARQGSPIAPCALPPGAYTHDRFYFRFSQGWGYQSLSGRGSQGQANVSGFASSGALLLGGTPGQGIVMGGGLRFASASGSLSGGQYDGYNVTGVTILLGPFVDWFPDVHGGWHIGAMIGLDVLGISNSAISESAGGFAGTLFGGYDFWIGPQWSLGILAAATTGTSGELNDQNNHDSGYGVTPYSFVLEWSLLLH